MSQLGEDIRVPCHVVQAADDEVLLGIGVSAQRGFEGLPGDHLELERRVDGLVKTLGIEGISKSQVSSLAKSLDETAAAFRSRPLDAGPYTTYVWLDAVAMRVREGGRVVQPVAVVATAVSADRHREILRLDLVTSEDGAG